MDAPQRLAKRKRPHSHYFDSLVQLVPARFYYDLDAQRFDLKYMKKQQRQLAKAAIKQQGKVNKRAKLDPTGSAMTLQVQQARVAQRKQQQDSNRQPNAGAAGTAAALVITPTPAPKQAKSLKPNISQVVQRAELQARLKQRLEEFRTQRRADDITEPAPDSNAATAKHSASALQSQQTRKRQPARELKQQGQQQRNGKQPHRQQHTSPEPGDDATRTAASPPNRAPAPSTPPAIGRKPSAGDEGKPPVVQQQAASKLAFGAINVKTPKELVLQEGKIKMKKSKTQLLAMAEAKQASQQAGEAPPEQADKGGSVWEGAVMRARGEKVMDDAKLLRRSVKREAREKQKSKAAWEARVQQQREGQAAKQKKRTENLQRRAQMKKDKKKARREAKLLRAGFEGRRNGGEQTQGGQKPAGQNSGRKPSFRQRQGVQKQGGNAKRGRFQSGGSGGKRNRGGK